MKDTVFKKYEFEIKIERNKGVSENEIEVHGLGFFGFRRKKVEKKFKEFREDVLVRIEVFVAEGVLVVKRDSLVKYWGEQYERNKTKVRVVKSIKQSHRAKVL